MSNIVVLLVMWVIVSVPVALVVGMLLRYADVSTRYPVVSGPQLSVVPYTSADTLTYTVTSGFLLEEATLADVSPINA